MHRFSKPKLQPKFRLPQFKVPALIARLWSRFFRGTRKVVAVGAAVVIVIMLPVVIWQLRSPTQKVDAAWFDANYSYRKKIPLTNSSTAQTDFQIQVTVDTASLITAGKLLNTCADIRATDANGKSLPYWIEPNTCNTASTLIWIKVPSIPTSGADVYIYYGNPSAISQASTTATFIRDMNAAAVNWPFDDTVSTQSYARALEPALATGRNLIINGTFAADTDWNKGTGWTIASGVAHADGTGSIANIQTTVAPPMVAGRVYTVTYTVSNYVSGTVRALVCASGNGTLRSANGTYVENVVCLGSIAGYIQSFSSFIGDIDNVTITEQNIPNAPAIQAATIMTDGTMEAATTAAWTSVNSATLSKQTGTPRSGTQVLRVARNGVSTPLAGQTILSIGTAYRVYGYGRGDGSSVPIVTNGPSTTLYTGTNSTAWQQFDVTFVATATDIRIGSNTNTNTQYAEFDDVVLGLDTGMRSGELMADGNMETSGTGTDWTSVNSASLSKQTGTPHGGTQVLRVTYNAVTNPAGRQRVLNNGKRYNFTGFARSDGTATPLLQVGATINPFSGTTSTSWQAIDTTFTATGTTLDFYSITSTAATYTEWDDISVTEVSPMVALTANGVVVAASSAGHLSNAFNFDGTNDYVNAYSGPVASVFNENEGTAVVWAKVSGAGVWTDGTDRRIIRFLADSNNLIMLRRSTTNNQLVALYSAGGVSSQVSFTSLGGSIGWFQLAISWSKSTDQVKVYANGAQVGSTQTGLGTWVGNLASTTTVFGASSTSATNPWSGMINDARIYSRALSDAEIADQYNANYDTQNYSTVNYPGKELIRKFNTGVVVGALAAEETTPGAGLYWTMEEGVGTTVHDSSLNANSGTLGGTTLPTWQTSDLCALGKCLYFDGVSSKVTGSRVSSGLSTVSFWIKPNKAEGLGILNLDGGTHKVSSSTTGVITATGWSSPTYYINGLATTTPTLTANAWNHVEITTATPFDTTSSFTLGTDGTNFAQGYIDEVRFYAYARTATQVKADYEGAGTALGILSQRNQQLSGLVAQWPLDDAAAQPYTRVVNPGVTTGRNVVLNGTFSDSSAWSLGTNATISGGTLNITAGSSSLTTQLPDITIGRAYTVSYTISNYTAGNLLMELGATGSSRSSNGSFTDIIVATSTTFTIFGNSTFAGSIDNVTIAELNIPTSPSTQPTQLLADGTMEAAGTSAWTAATATLSKQTGTPHGGSQVLRIARNGGNFPDAHQAILTSGTWYRVTGYVRSDGNATPRVTNVATVYYTGTTSTSWQTFDVLLLGDSSTNFYLSQNSLVDGQYVEYDDVIVSADNYVRTGELLQDGNMETSGTGYWTAGNSATLTKDTTSPHGGTQNLRVTRNAVNTPYAQTLGSMMQVGRRYRITGWFRGDSTFTSDIRDSAGNILVTSTSSNTWQSFDVASSIGGTSLRLVSNANSGTGYGEFDDISVTELAPMIGLPGNGATLGAATGGGHGQTAASFDGTNDYVNLYNGSLNSALNPTEGTMLAWAKVASSGAWTDGTLRRVFQLASTSSTNSITVIKSTSSNTLTGQYQAGGVSTSVNATTATSGWFQVAITWSKSADQFKFYFNGVQAGSTITGLGTWNDNLSSTLSLIGNGSTSPANQPWSGLINDVRLYNRPLTATEIANLYGTAPGPVVQWKMDEASWTNDCSTATVLDSSTNGNSGKSCPNSTGATGGAIGKVGKAGNFNGSSQYILGPSNTSLQMTGALSISAWVNPSAVDSANHTIAGRWQVNVDQHYVLQLGSDNKFHFYFDYTGSDASTGQIVVDSTTTASANTWYHVQGVFDPVTTTIKIYINGVLEGTTTNASATTGVAGTIELTAASKKDSGGTYFEFWPGKIDEVEVYNYARTAAQVNDSYAIAPVGASGGGLATTLPKPVGWWKFDEGTGTTANNSGIGGSALNGTLTSMATAPSTSTSGWNSVGKIGKALNFDGSNDYVSMGNSSTFAVNGPFTISAWVNPTSFSAATPPDNSIIGRYDNASSARNYLLYTDSTGQLIFETSTNGSCASGGAVLLSTGKTLPTGSWSYVAGVYDGSKMHAYINGIEVGTPASQTSICTATTTFVVGDRFGGGSVCGANCDFLGSIDNAKFYNTGLTADQVRQDMLSGAAIDVGATAPQESSLGSSGTGNAPIGQWEFDERTGTTAKDISGQAHDATLNGSFNNNNDSGWGVGKYGSAVHYDGVDDVTQAASTAYNLAGVSDLTLEAWVKMDTISSSTNPRIVAQKTDASNGYHLAYISSGSGTCAARFIFEVEKAGTYYASGCSTSNAAAVANTWYHLTGTFNNTTNTATLYVNSVPQVAGVTQSLTLAVTGTVTWASSATVASAQLDGYIDQTKIYNYARSQAQISYDYNRGAPLAWFKFDECQGTTLNDAGSNNAASLVVGATGTQTAAGTCNTSSTPWGNGATGKYNASLNFDGTDDYVCLNYGGSCTTNTLLAGITNARTISFWEKTSGSGRMAFLSATSLTIDINQSNTGQLRIFNGGTNTFSNLRTLNNGQWHFITISQDSTTTNIYIDGNLDISNAQAEAAGTGTWYLASDLLVAGRYLNGQMDDVRIFNYTMTASQIKTIYNQGAALRFGPVTGNP